MRTIKLPLTIAQHEMIKAEAVKNNFTQTALGKYFNNGEPNTSITNYTNDLLALDKAEGIMETYNYPGGVIR